MMGSIREGLFFLSIIITSFRNEIIAFIPMLNGISELPIAVICLMLAHGRRQAKRHGAGNKEKLE